MQAVAASLSTANRLYREGELGAALAHYQRCLRDLKALGDAPKSLLAHCESQLRLCLGQSLAPSPVLDPAAPQLDHDEYRLTPPDPVAPLPKVSVLIPHFNSGGLLYEALDSVAAQRFREIETLVVDDASTDGSIDLARLAAYPEWMRLRVLRLRVNSGPARCRNLGLLRSAGRALCLLDADDYVDAGAIESRWQLLNAQPTLAGAFVPMVYVDGQRRPLGSAILNDVDAVSFTDFISNKFPCSALMFRRRALLQDPFDESLVHGEDYECFSRIAQRGGLYAKAPEGQVFYRQHGASLTHKDTRQDLSQRLAITQIVHTRRLDWAHGSTRGTLGEATIQREGSLRAFPVACLYALRGKLDDALEIGRSLDADMVAAVPPARMKGTIRFFLTREEQVATDRVDAFLAQADHDALMRSFDAFFSMRHRGFVVALLGQLLGQVPASAPQLMGHIMGAPLAALPWSQLLHAPSERWRGYLLLHRDGESMPPSAQEAVRAHLAQRADLEGLFACRICESGGEVFTDLESLAPADPDAPATLQLGRQLWPAVVLHELAARSVRHWVAAQADASADAADPAWIEGQALAALAALRVKVAGGLPDGVVVASVPGGDAR
jgi:GT2 family glycosyltransferase